ncbi:MAG: hypothetical protein JWQ91_1821 [Aeromicrobium sp.]|uniref:MCE family protein n=1 Tax=Aeromicrobium sp. TaxID=1871063 RepID=UPI002605FC14|nr:MCE family protein [Aeromicrobium sp.]MCW2824904.1 hypothetical protein [Aeromicrobium sp.]
MMSWTGSLGRAIAVSVAVVVAVVAIVLVATPHAPRGTALTLRFTDTTGLYVGNAVQVIGVPIGEVTGIEPRGTYVDVTVHVDQDVPVAARTGAIVMQSALVTDRFIELTVPWERGPRLRDGAVVGLDRTRSPVDIDDVVTAVDDLLVALQEPAPDGTTVGDLVSTAADRLEGQGGRIARAIDAAGDALGTVDGVGDDVRAITGDLEVLMTMLAKRDQQVRELADSVGAASTLLAGQRKDLVVTLEALRRLTTTARQVVKETRTSAVTDVKRAADVVETLSRRTAEIGDTFDTLPLVAENLTRAYDPELRRTRVRFDLRNTGPFAEVGRGDLCELLRVVPCRAVTNSDGTGLIDPLLQWFPSLFPEDL